jgi:hypothetical protein
MLYVIWCNISLSFCFIAIFMSAFALNIISMNKVLNLEAVPKNLKLMLK